MFESPATIPPISSVKTLVGQEIGSEKKNRERPHGGAADLRVGEPISLLLL